MFSLIEVYLFNRRNYQIWCLAHMLLFTCFYIQLWYLDYKYIVNNIISNTANMIQNKASVSSSLPSGSTVTRQIHYVLVRIYWDKLWQLLQFLGVKVSTVLSSVTLPVAVPCFSTTYPLLHHPPHSSSVAPPHLSLGWDWLAGTISNSFCQHACNK